MRTMNFYPIQDFGPIMQGLVIGGLGIFHVFTAQFAIGGGFLMCFFEYLHQRKGIRPAKLFLESYFKVLILISFVLGALTGVGMWFTTIQISPYTIGTMVEEFHWLWATEWTFFCLEVVTGYAYYRCQDRLSPALRMQLLVLYSFAAWMSLFWINGILSWQLTPGNWIDSRAVWDGFFNPSFWPSLGFRTVASLAIASLVSAVVINTLETSRREKEQLLRYVLCGLLPMVLMPVFGAWYLAVMPEDSRGWVMGGSVAMTLFLNIAVGASALIGAYAIYGYFAARFYMNLATSVLLCVLAFGATAGGEFVREGARKPYTIRKLLYSNSIRPEDVAELRQVGVLSKDPYPMRDPGQYPAKSLLEGAQVYRAQCAVCHTVSGVNGVLHLTETWSVEQKRMNIAKLERTKGFMPPFAGTPRELEHLVQYLNWETAQRPSFWPVIPEDQSLEIESRIKSYFEAEDSF